VHALRLSAIAHGFGLFSTPNCEKLNVVFLAHVDSDID